MICKLRRIAVSMTGKECDKAIDDLKESDYWSGKLQEYMHGNILVTHQEGISSFVKLLTMCVKRIM